MAMSRVLLKSLAVCLVAGHLSTSCGGDDSRPTNLGAGGGGGTGGTDASIGGTGGKTGGTGGKIDSGVDAKADQSTDAPKDVASDVDGDVSADATSDVDGDVSADADGDADTDADADAGVDATFCSNTVKDFDETDVDCGGLICPGCDTGKVCIVSSDCASKKCNATNKVCDAPACTDGIQNGAETDVDCGGINCSKCGDNKKCLAGIDCTSGVCGATGFCAPASCTDNVKNGNEGDIDCGGSCPSQCGLGQSCKVSTDCSSAVCTGSQCKCPAGMVLAPATGGGAYCIEQYEITYEQYELFWQANPNFTLAECSWNTGVGKYTPNGNWPAPVGAKKYPVRNVDWCDAWAYCKWAGKRLCGKQGGGSVLPADYTDPAKSQWHNACTAGANTYPYGNAYKSSSCIGADFAYTPDAAPQFFGNVTPYPGSRVIPNLPPQDCLGAAPGLYDMSANVAEWEDSCTGTAGASDTCQVRGGSFKESGANIACAASRTAPRNEMSDEIGIRCCFP